MQVTRDETIPCLAWLAVGEGGEYRYVIGRSVALAADGIFEGVRAGQNGPVFGSGVSFDPLTFITPHHCFEFVFLVRDKKRETDFISNSICFCLARLATSLRRHVIGELAKSLTTSTHAATMLGALRYEPTVLNDSRCTVKRFMCGTVDADYRFAPANSSQCFSSFSQYRSYLAKTLDALFIDGASRSNPLTPITALSQGYDSPAVAVLASQRGCKEAITLSASYQGRDDSGADIAMRFGLKLYAFNHVLGENIETLIVPFTGSLKRSCREFIATAGHGDGVVFAPFEPALTHRILLTGAWGDSIWERNSTVSDGLPVRVRFGKSMTEFRLRVGFAHVPVPVIGAFDPTSIVKLSKSREMMPFSIGGDYDRPIPRRIAEEAGLERGSFARQKTAMAPDPTNHSRLWSAAVSHLVKRYRADRDTLRRWGRLVGLSRFRHKMAFTSPDSSR